MRRHLFTHVRGYTLYYPLALHTHGGLVRRLQLDNPPFCAARAPAFSLSSASLHCVLVLVCSVPARCFPPLELGDAPNVVGTLALDAHLVRVRGRVDVRVRLTWLGSQLGLS